VREEYAFSQRRACGLVTVAVSSYRYQSRRSDEPLRTRLVELAREKPRFGYRRLHVLLGRSGEQASASSVSGGLMIRGRSGNIAPAWDNRCASGRRRTRSGH
jgi:hypothetical protein